MVSVVCNPCVPDPNTAPPQTTSPSILSPRSHSRSQSLVGGGAQRIGLMPRLGFMSSTAPNDAPSRNRSVFFVSHTIKRQHVYLIYPSLILTTQSFFQGPRIDLSSRNRYESTENRIFSGTPPANHPASSFANPSYGQHYRGGYASEAGPSSSSSGQRELPPPPPISEEDECPVCHRELPAKFLPNSESLREAHITVCITAHSTYGSVPDSPETQNNAESRLAAQRTTRRTGVFPYLATEKDCVDSAECTICLEEFEVGVPMARLECLCRFHKSCIAAWFVNHPGRCPVHQHDSFGY
jgi:hypothetical protein